MASSGSVNFTVTRNEIINEAALEIGVKKLSQAIGGGLQLHIERSLNLMVKQWQGTADFAPGLKVWSRRRATVFLQSNQHQYALGPTGDNATESFVATNLTASAATSATSLTVDSITGIASADIIGIVLTDGTIHWDVVNGAPTGSTVVITTGLASGADSLAKVYAYTTKMRRPIEILTQSLRNSDNEDTPMGSMDLYEFEALTAKTSDGTPTSAFYEAQRTNGQLYLNAEPDDVTKQIRIVYLSDIEDFDNADDNPDYPVEWFRALKFNLAVEIAPGLGRTVSPELAALAAGSLAIAQNLNPDTTVDYFQPGLD